MKDRIRRTCVMMGIKNFDIGDDLKVHVNGGVYLSNSRVTGTLPFKFGTVQGTFHAAYCDLYSLDNMPDEVGGHFNIGYNSLTSLDGIPRKIGGNFYFNNMELNSLYVPYNVIIKGKTFIKNYPILNPEELSVFINYQHYYNAYDEDGEIIEEEAKILIQEIQEGLR